MLALTDEALALLCIAAGRVAQAKRGRWLRQLAQQLEPPPGSNRLVPRAARVSNGAARVRSCRSRQASGRAVLRVEVDFNATSGALFAAGFIRESEIDDAEAVSRALEKVVALLPVRL